MTVLVPVSAVTAGGLERKATKTKVITWLEAENIARDSAVAYFKKQDIRFDSLLLKPCDVVHRLDSSFGTVYLFLIACEGKDTTFNGIIYVDSLNGLILPFSAAFSPIHPESKIIWDSYYDKTFPRRVFNASKPDNPSPHIWSLVFVTYNTLGYCKNEQGDDIFPLRDYWNGLAWWGTDPFGYDYFVASNGRLFMVFDLDLNIKRHYGRPTKKEE
jgi:hypothetical protein